jgi:hypothetical protein
MGVSTNAILAFGINLGEDLPEAMRIDDDDDCFDYDEWLQKRFGMEWTEDRPKDFWEKFNEARDAFPVDLISHCSGDYPEYFLAVRGTDTTARRGCPEVIEALPAIESADIDALKAFCDEIGIEWEEPKWHLFSIWH